MFVMIEVQDKNGFQFQFQVIMIYIGVNLLLGGYLMFGEFSFGRVINLDVDVFDFVCIYYIVERYIS